MSEALDPSGTDKDPVRQTALRAPGSQIQRFRIAAALEGITLNNFLRRAASARATEILQKAGVKTP